MKVQVNLKARLVKEREKGAPITIFVAQVALFSTILFLRETTFFSKYDANGFITAILYYIASSGLLSLKFCMSQPNFDPSRPYQFKPNLTANLLLGFILGIYFGELFEMSLFSLCAALSMLVLFLSVLIITKKTDFGLFGFLVGTVGSVGSNYFGFTFTSWLVAVICVFLLGFKYWLDKNWLELVEDHHRPLSGSVPISDQLIEGLIFVIFFFQLDRYLFRTHCQIITEPVRCISWPSWMTATYVFVWVCWFILVIVCRTILNAIHEQVSRPGIDVSYDGQSRV